MSNGMSPNRMSPNRLSPTRLSPSPNRMSPAQPAARNFRSLEDDELSVPTLDQVQYHSRLAMNELKQNDIYNKHKVVLE